MANEVDLTGPWAGEYRQHGGPHPIAAEFVQEGNRLTGAMRDLETEQERTVFEAAIEAGLPPGADEQIVEALRAQHPEAGRGPVRFVSRVPERAALDGEVRGRAVAFRKRYEGESFGGYRLGECLVGETRPGHVVHYEGEVSDDGRTLAGRWWIPAAPLTGGRMLEGAFTLRRDGD